MDGPRCSIQPNNTISVDPPLQFYQFNESRGNMTTCVAGSTGTYIRPDDGASLLPWPYTLAWLLVHLPVTILRVRRWQKVQTLSILLAVVSIWFTLQAYTTHLNPNSVMVWMPLAIVLDVGAMMQLVSLIIQENGTLLLWVALKQSLSGRTREDRRPEMLVRDSMRDSGLQSSSGPGTVQTVSLPPTLPRGHGLVGKAWVTVLAFVLMTFLIVLQMIGLRHAVAGRKLDLFPASGQFSDANVNTTLSAKWCSPLFQASVAVLADLTGPENCTVRHVNLAEAHTIGCVTLPGTEQRAWLTATVVILSLSLAIEAVDAAILILVGANAKWFGTNVKRPWLSMVAGNAILVTLLVVSTVNSLRLPAYIDEEVWVFKWDGSLNVATVCSGRLKSPGVRGEIISWTDGFLNSWSDTYFGVFV